MGQLDNAGPLSVHTHCFGRPSGIWAFEKVIEIAKKSKDVWIGT